MLLGFDMPMFDTGIDTPPEAAIVVHRSASTSIAAMFNLVIPHTGVEMRPMPRIRWSWCRDFWHCNARLWRDKLGQISLATTTLFWGVGGNLRYIVLAWAAAALGYGTTQASSLRAWWRSAPPSARCSRRCACGCDMATSVMPMGIAMGVAGDPDELHPQRLGRRAVPDPARRAAAASWSCR